MLLCFLWMACGASPAPQAISHSSRAQLLNEVQRRAFRFFWEQADPKTGLVKDRAGNFEPDTYTVASIASTGYALASLPIAVERHMVLRSQAQRRAQQT